MNEEFDIKNTHVPDKLYAYMIQSHHMLYELVECQDGDVVSTEVLDDVGVIRNNNTIDVIQLKSVTSDRNPISDKSVDLWKTFYNWIMAVKAGELNVNKTNFKLFITVLAKGYISSKFNDAKSKKDALEAWNETRDVFYNIDGSEKDIADTYGNYVRTFYLQENKDIAIGIIERFSLKTCFENYSEVVKKQFSKIMILDDLLDGIYPAIIGWIDLEVAHCVENKKCISIPYIDFKKQLSSIVKEYNQKYSLKSFRLLPDEGHVKWELSHRRRYIEQLELINAPYEDKIEAINDFFCASNDRFVWAKKGLTSKDQIDRYEDSLKKHWNNKKRINSIETVRLKDEEKGYALYAKCKDSKIDMENYLVPDTFYSGCLQSLSNDLKIGWHPYYDSKLRGEKSDGTE